MSIPLELLLLALALSFIAGLCAGYLLAQLAARARGR